MALHASARVAYVAYAFPVLTQTFTTREVRALREAGLDLQVFAVRQDPAAENDPEARAERSRTHYLPPPSSAAALGHGLAWLVRRPVRLLATLLACLGGPYAHDALAFRLRAVGHVLVGTALATALRHQDGFTRVHAQFVDAGSTVAFVAARLLDLPFSFTNHTAYNPFCLAPKARAADVVLSISEYDRDRLAETCAGIRDRIEVQRVGIRTGEWAALDRDPRPGRILTVAGLREKKGVDVLVRAVAKLHAAGRDVHLVVAGDGPQAARLRALASESDVDVEFLGAVGPGRVRSELSRASVFCLACKRARNGDIDGIPVVLMEAMAAGVPVVSTRLSGIPELVEDGVSGRLAEPGDVDSLAAALESALDTADGAGGDDPLTARARERVRGLHDLERNASRLVGILSRGMGAG